jgi:DnaJ-class molecular chaperone
MEDYYDILGVDVKSDQAEIKKAYKKLAVQYHPDKNPDGADMFAKVNEAYTILGDVDKRADYDLGTGFQREFSQFKDFYSTSNTQSNTVKRTKGDDVVLTLSITIDEIYKGCTKKVSYERRSACNVCGGSGASKYKKCIDCSGSSCDKCDGTTLVVDELCPRCMGTKHIIKNEVVDISITQDLRHNSIISITGKGHSSDNMGASGNLKCIINLIEDEVKLSGDDIIMDMHILPHDLVLGVTMTKNIFGKDIKVVIPPGSTTESHLLVKDYGLGDTGNLYFKLICVPSSSPMPEELDLYQDIKKLYRVL